LTFGGNRVRAFGVAVIGALLLGGCTAKPKATEPTSGPAMSGAGPPVGSTNVDLARDEYDRAVADYQNCILDNTANLSACERQRAAMNAAATVLFGRSNKRNTLVNE